MSRWRPSLDSMRTRQRAILPIREVTWCPQVGRIASVKQPDRRGRVEPRRLNCFAVSLIALVKINDRHDAECARHAIAFQE